MICQVCARVRGLEIPAGEVVLWAEGTCHTCRTQTLVCSELAYIHHTGADLPEDTGGADGIPP